MHAATMDISWKHYESRDIREAIKPPKYVDNKLSPLGNFSQSTDRENDKYHTNAPIVTKPSKQSATTGMCKL